MTDKGLRLVLERARAQDPAGDQEGAKGQRALARLLGISQAAVAQWRRVPPARCIQIEEILGVSRHEQRPDIFGPPPKRKR